MSCTRPIYALDLGVKENGKRNIKILSRRVDLSSIAQLEARYGKGNILLLPCGKCLACKLSKAREWAVRCVLEASQYDNSCFITLTYDDEHLPEDGLLHRKDLTDFIKRLRKKHEIRYFGCGEYGGSGHTVVNGKTLEHGRPHFHLIIFGFFPGDWKNGSSREISELWPFGFNYVDDCNFRTCNYVARYTTKKIYKNLPGEFICMSTHPGLGADWLKEHYSIFTHDAVYGPFGSSKVSNIPRYFEKLYESVDAAALQELKGDRIDKGTKLKLHEMLHHSILNVEDLYEYKEAIQIHEFEKKGKRREL
jgi:hypothetical protein